MFPVQHSEASRVSGTTQSRTLRDAGSILSISGSRTTEENFPFLLCRLACLRKLKIFSHDEASGGWAPLDHSK